MALCSAEENALDWGLTYISQWKVLILEFTISDFVSWKCKPQSFASEKSNIKLKLVFCKECGKFFLSEYIPCILFLNIMRTLQLSMLFEQS